MKNILFSLFFLATNLFTFQASGFQNKIRADFHNQDPSKDHIEAILENKSYDTTLVTQAYIGLCETMMAEYVLMPTSKWHHFSKGKKKINSALNANPNNCELRYIRLMVQLNTPGFLRYNTEIEDDLAFYIENLSSLVPNKHWQVVFTKNLLAGKNLTKSQHQSLEKLIVLIA